MIYIGIDPGKNGAMAAIEDGAVLIHAFRGATPSSV